MADANARRAVEQEKLNTWCARMGIQSSSDLAFWFTSYEEALREAGRAVADGWDPARRESEPGMAALVRHLFARETVRLTHTGMFLWPPSTPTLLLWPTMTIMLEHLAFAGTMVHCLVCPVLFARSIGSLGSFRPFVGAWDIVWPVCTSTT